MSGQPCSPLRAATESFVLHAPHELRIGPGVRKALRSGEQVRSEETRLLRERRREAAHATADVTARAWGRHGLLWLASSAHTSTSTAWDWTRADRVHRGAMPAWVLHEVDDEAFGDWCEGIRASRAGREAA